MGKVIALCNQKGGVGKTTTSVNLGVALVRQGKKVLCVDADPQGDLTKSLGYYQTQNLSTTATLIDMAQSGRLNSTEQIEAAILHHNEGVDIIPANLSLSITELQLVSAFGREAILKKIIEPIKNNYDYILIDCMRSVGVLTVNALTASDSVIIPVDSQYLASDNMSLQLYIINQVREFLNPNLEIDGILFTKYEKNTNLSKMTSNIIKENFGDYIHIYDTIIPKAIKTAEAPAYGQSVFEYDITGTVASAYEELSKEVIGDGKGKWMGLSETRVSCTEQLLFDAGTERQ